MNRVKFTDLPRPFVCALVQQPTLEDTIAMMHQSDYDGAQAIGVDLCRMKDVSDDDLRKIMRCTTKPVYAMCYRYGDDGRTDDDLGTTIHANLIYHNGDKVADHFKAAGSLKVGEGWTHCSAEIAVGKDCTEESNIFAVYTNPIGDCGVNYEIDNIVLRKK